MILRIWKKNGIDILDGKEPVKGGLCVILGDNLGSHCIGGFVENFSSVSHWCRWCLLEGEEFQEDPCSIGQLRNEENYQVALEELDRLKNENLHPGVSHVQGVKFDSLFNELDNFHVCKNGLPPCLGHDLFEGVVAYDVALILKHLIKEKKWFTYNYLNQRISQFKYHGSDKSNQPCPVSHNADKLGGQAVQNWTLVRLLPLLVRNKIMEPNDDYWQLFLKLQQIIELVCAPQISEAQIAVLNNIVDEYLEDRFCLFPDDRMKPKHHFIKHYARLILEHGPLIRSWTMRYESRHTYFKQCTRRLQNFKKLCCTLSERHQLLQTYRCAGSYLSVNTDAKDTVPLDLETYSDAIRDALVTVNASAEDEVTYELKLRGTTYKKGMYVPVGYDDDGEMLFGEIVFMLIRDMEVYFVLRIYRSEFNFDFHVYSLYPSNDTYACLQSDDLIDYYPLPAYGRGNGKVIALKHAVSYDL